MQARKFSSISYFQIAGSEPVRSVISQSEHAVVIAWHVEPEQHIKLHTHPHGQDTWTVLQGSGLYYLETNDTVIINAGDVVIAYAGQVHGVLNNSNIPLRFISVVSPADSGYQLLE